MTDNPYDWNNREKSIQVLVLGIGNPIMEDDAAGLELLKLVRESRQWPDDVVFEDGATLAMALLPAIEDARAVLFLDAMRTGAAPGTVLRRNKEELPGFFARVMSAHEIGLHQVLAAANLRRSLPEWMEMVGIEAANTRCVYPMGEEVKNALPEATDLAIERIEALLALCKTDKEDMANA